MPDNNKCGVHEEMLRSLRESVEMIRQDTTAIRSTVLGTPDHPDGLISKVAILWTFMKASVWFNAAVAVALVAGAIRLYWGVW